MLPRGTPKGTDAKVESAEKASMFQMAQQGLLDSLVSFLELGLRSLEFRVLDSLVCFLEIGLRSLEFRVLDSLVLFCFGERLGIRV